MISIPSGTCCGCSACASICPKNAIIMEQNAAGFYYPQINDELCIKCRKCEKVCPEQNFQWRRKDSVLECYASVNKDEAVRERSSSGGVFFELAKEVLDDKGHVYGCAWDSVSYAKHIMIDQTDQLPKLMKSKYVQSDVNCIFQKVKKDLDVGTKVLFSGTPCQNAGLLNYLGKSYPNLLTVEFICHGVPSQGMLDEYVKEYEQKNGTKVTALDFRAKKKGWEPLTLGLILIDGSKVYEEASKNPYYRAFLLNLSINYSCNKCKFNFLPRAADITLGDFWKIRHQEAPYQDNKGVSCVVINSIQGKEYYEKIKSAFVCKKVDLDEIRQGNPFINGHCKAHRNTKQFVEFVKKYGYEKSVELLLKPTKMEIVLEILKYKWRQLVRRLGS